MKGHIRERSPGRWAIVIDVRDPQTGQRKRKWHSFVGTKRASISGRPPPPSPLAPLNAIDN
jgi:hypothetical protein